MSIFLPLGTGTVFGHVVRGSVGLSVTERGSVYFERGSIYSE